MDDQTDPRQVFDEVIATGDPAEFVRRAYRLVLRREASEGEVRRAARRLKYLPFVFTRDRLLRRLLQSPEAGLVGRASGSVRESLLKRGAATGAETRQAVAGAETRLVGALVDLAAAVEQTEGRLQAAVLRAEERAGLVAAGATDMAARAAAAAEQVLAALGRQEAATAQLSAAVVAHADRLSDLMAGVGRQTAGMTEQLTQVVDAHRFEQRVGFDQLRLLGSVTADRVGAAVAKVERPAVVASDQCRVCGGPLDFRFTRRVLHDRYDADYHECRDCRTLQVPNPYWLAEAYAAEATPQAWNPDPGRFARNFTVFQLLHALLDSGLGGWRKRVLDFGGGYGLFTQMLFSAGLDAWGYDPYVPHPYLAAHRVVPDPSTGPADQFDVVTAFEVLEHLTDTDGLGRLLQHAIAPGGAVLLTTGLYDPAVHGPDWPYLSLASGQHVTLWSRAGLGRFAEKYGFRAVGFAVDGGLPAVAISRLEPGDLAEVIARGERLLGDPQYRAGITRRWVLAEPPSAALRGVVDAITPTTEPRPAGERV